MWGSVCAAGGPGGPAAPHRSPWACPAGCSRTLDRPGIERGSLWKHLESRFLHLRGLETLNSLKSRRKRQKEAAKFPFSPRISVRGDNGQPESFCEAVPAPGPKRDPAEAAPARPPAELGHRRRLAPCSAAPLRGLRLSAPPASPGLFIYLFVYFIISVMFRIFFSSRGKKKN